MNAKTTTRRANAYGGKCLKGCGGYVEAGEGWLGKSDAGKWGAEHAEACPEQVKIVTPAELEAGMYRNDRGIFKVQRAVHGSGLMTAKRLDVEAQRFVYQGLATRFVTHADRMSVEQAVEFGRIYGFCVRCAATLTDEESIERGMGPVCAEKV